MANSAVRGPDERPLETQQDFFLFHLLNTLGSASLREKLSLNQPPALADTLLSPIFPELPDVCADAFKALLRTLVGLEDFARSNAHYSRRKSHPCLHNLIYQGLHETQGFCIYHQKMR